MPSVNDPTTNEEDTPDDLKGPKISKKKQKKKAAKQRAPEEYKDSSSEGPKPSPDLPPLIDHTNPSPPPSPQPRPPTPPPPSSPQLHPSNDEAPEDDLLDHLAVPFEKPSPVSNIVLSPEPSPPQDGVIASKNGDRGDTRSPSRLPIGFSLAQHIPSLSSSPQGGIRLPPTSPQLQYTYGASPPAHAALPLRERKTSTISHPSRPASFYEPPPPHLPQRHFTRRPEMDFGLAAPSESAITAGSKGFYCGFDSLEKSNAGTSPAANNVVLVGTQGGLDVYRLLRQRSDIVGRLEGLRGAILDAKILPWTERHDPFYALRPLVMCVVHGPIDESINQGEDQPSPSEPTIDASTPYQTTVEIYSLASAESVCCLYESPLMPRSRARSSTSIGNIRTAAEGRFITVTSGTSGEVYVFSPYSLPVANGVPPFRCIAKFWTAVETSAITLGPEVPGTQKDDLHDVETKTPIWALSQRWLAIRPPLLSSSQVSLQGTPLLSPTNPDPPGVLAHVSPPPPTVNCGVDAPFSNTLFDRVTKQATQEIRKGAQWVGEQGKHVWNAYWGRSLPSQGDGVHNGFQSPAQIDTTIFPPTHAQSNDPHPVHVEPASVAIIDLHKLLEFEQNPAKGALTPLSTFCLPDGCSFMSFAPGGLSLLTTNQIGDSSIIWDLTRITNGKVTARYSPVPATGAPYVCMLARFARQTPSVVTEVAWSAHGNRVAILTQKGTIHLHEVPSSIFRPFAPLNGALSPVLTGIPSPGSSPQEPAPFAGLVNSVRARIQGLRAPTNSNSLGATVSNASAYARHTGRKALKQGVNMATDTALKIRHHEETKIRLQPKQHTLRPACLRWLSGRESGLIATVFDGKVRLHTVKSNHYVQGKRTASYLTASRKPVGESALNTINGDAFRADSTHPACARTGPHGFWALNKVNAMKRLPGKPKQSSGSILQDKDTSPTYLPFHRAPQVNLFTFTDEEKKATSPAGRGMGSEESWVFGLPLCPTTRITCEQSQAEDEYAQNMTGADMEDLLEDVPDYAGQREEIGVFEI